MKRNRTPFDELEPKVKNAVNRLRALPKFRNEEKLEVKMVAEVSGVSRSAIYKYPKLRNLCNISLKEVTEQQVEAESLTEEQKALRELISCHERYEEIIGRFDDCLEETTKKIFDNYVRLKAESSFRDHESNNKAADQIAKLRDENRALEKKLADERIHNKYSEDSPSSDNVIPFYKKFHIAPDRYLVEGNEYVWDKDRASRAWAKARREFEQVISAEQPEVVYLLSGPQNTGKTTWIREHQPILPGRHVYFDATLPTVQERVDLAYTAKEICPTAEIVIVRMIAAFETCIERQEKRGQSQFVPTPVIERTFKVFEEVSVNEPVDSIIIVRDKSDVPDS